MLTTITLPPTKVRYLYATKATTRTTCKSFHYLRPGEHVDPVEVDLFDAAPEVLLVAQEDLAEVAHATHEDPEVHVQLVEGAGDLNPEKKQEQKKRENTNKLKVRMFAKIHTHTNLTKVSKFINYWACKPRC